MKYFSQIDSFRFFAAFCVLTAHWLHHIPWVSHLKLGFIGVDFFFVISGFLISFKLYELREKVEEKKLSLGKGIKQFMVRRAFRIFPIYYFILFLSTLFNKGAIREAFLYNVTYTSNFYFIKTQEWASTFSQFWSLSVEEHFYLTWPFIVLSVGRKKLLPFVVLITAASISFRYFSFVNSYDYFTVHIHTFSCLDLFMIGALLAMLLKWQGDRFMDFFGNNQTQAFVLLGFLISYLALVNYQDSPVFTWVFFRTLFGLFCAGLIGLLVVGFKGRAKRIFENRYLLRGGQLSYAIYLVHNFVPGILLGIKKLEWPVWVEFSIYFVTTIIICELLYRFVENPMRKIGYKWSQSSHPSVD